MVTSYVGIMQVLNGEMTLGGMAFSTLLTLLLRSASWSAWQMSIQQAQISIKRLTEIMDYESEQDETREYTEMERSTVTLNSGDTFRCMAAVPRP